MNNKRQTRKTHFRNLGVILTLLILAIIGWQLLRRTTTDTPPTDGQTATIFYGDLSANLTASGQVKAQQQARLALNISGTVAELYVAEGDTVQAGQPLLTLNTAELDRAIANAHQTVIIQEANLAKLLAPATPADATAAAAAVASAQARLNDLLAGPTATEIAAAEADVRAAAADIGSAAARLNSYTATADADAVYAAQLDLELAQQSATSAAEQHSAILVTEPNEFLTADRLAEMELAARTNAVQANANLTAAQEALDNLLHGNSDSISVAQANLAAATAQRDATQARLDLLLAPPSAAQIAAAAANLAQAEANLDRLQRGPSAWQVTQAEVQVAQAQVSLHRAEQNLANATLVAPFEGLVTAVYTSPGESASGILIDLVDMNSLEIVLDVDEADMGQISSGQMATVTLESWPDMPIASTVTAVAPTASQNNSSDLVTFAVYLSLTNAPVPVRIGMTANARLITAERHDVLLLPNAAISLDRGTGQATVNRVVSQTAGEAPVLEVVPVTLGLRDGRYTEIATSNLNAGDLVWIGQIIPQETVRPGSRSPFSQTN